MRDASDEVTAAHAAALTGLSERTIRRKIAAGEIPARHLARNRYAIHVRDLPVRQSPHDLLARLEALENRVRLLELQYAHLASGGVASEGKPSGAEASEAVAQAEAAPADGSRIPATEAAEVHQLLSQLARETQRLAPLMTALMNGLPASDSTHDAETQEGRANDATRRGKRGVAAQ
jgi:hypothetical protein